MSDPGPPGGPSPLRLGGFVLLGIAAVSAVVGLVSLAGGGDNAKATTPPSVNAAPTLAPGSPAPAPGATVPPAPAVPPTGPANPPTAPAVPPAPGQPPAPGAQTPPGAPPAGHAPPGQPPAPGAPPARAQPAPGAPPGGQPPGAQPPTGQPPVAPSVPNPQAEKPLPGAGLPGEGTTPSYGGGKGGTAARAPLRVYNNSLIKELAQHAAADFRDSGWKVTDIGNYPYGVIPTSTVYYRPGTEEQAAAQALANSFGLRAEPRFPGIADADPGLIVIVTKDYQRR